MRARYILAEIVQGLWRNITMVISVVIVTFFVASKAFGYGCRFLCAFLHERVAW